MVKKGKWENRHERFYSHRKSWILRAGYLYPRYNKRIIKDFHHRQVDENPWICTLSRVVYKQRHYTLRTRARGIAGACTIIPRCLSNVCVRSIYVYTYIYIDMYVYMCIYIYTPVYGRWENMRQLFLSFEGRIGTKDTRRPPHGSPWWSRIIYRVAWLILGLASGCLLTPEICLLPSLLLHRILLLSIIPSLYSYYFESRRFFDTFIPSSFLSIVKLLGNSFERERRKEKRALIFVRFRKGIFLHFPFAFTQPPRLGYFLLLPLSSSLPFFLAWRPLEPRRVAADSWSGLLIYAYLSYPTTLLHPPTCICK